MISQVVKNKQPRRSTSQSIAYSACWAPIKGFLYRTIKIVDRRTSSTDTPNKLIGVTIEAHKNSRPICSCCGKRGSTYDTQKQPRAFDYIPLWKIPVRFYYCMRRVDCCHCQRILTEAVPLASPPRSHPPRLVRHVAPLNQSHPQHPPHALNILDRFHTAKKPNEAVDEIRK